MTAIFKCLSIMSPNSEGFSVDILRPTQLQYSGFYIRSIRSVEQA